MLELARSLAELQRQGWQPDRTIVLAGWDGEEYGQLGSTEWAEEIGHDLIQNAVTYVDMDSAGAGSYFYAAGVPSLDNLFYEVTREVEEPRTPGQSVFDDWVARTGETEPSIGRLGGGYDYEVWIHHLGIPTIQRSFDYAASGNYHSSYDDLFFQQTWGDPGYLHHAAMAKLAGITAMRLASADILPFQYSTYAEQVSGYLDRLNAPGGVVRGSCGELRTGDGAGAGMGRGIGGAGKPKRGDAGGLPLHPALPGQAGGVHQRAAHAGGA
jgi:N-acetylated-alpha-linked acidic dipeptidase